jgi:cold shock CspA family protein
MQIPPVITYRDVPKSETLEALIREKITKLETVCDYITSCRVAIERRQLYQQSGNPYRVRIDLTIPPGHELVIKRRAGEGSMHDDLGAVVRNAFEAARRKVRDLVERQRDIEVRPGGMAGATISRIFPEEGYGFIVTPEGREVYFHRNSVIGDSFESLTPGTVVRFEEEQGEDGPQATSVRILDRPVKVGGVVAERVPF